MAENDVNKKKSIVIPSLKSLVVSSVCLNIECLIFKYWIFDFTLFLSSAKTYRFYKDTE